MNSPNMRTYLNVFVRCTGKASTTSIQVLWKIMFTSKALFTSYFLVLIVGTDSQAEQPLKDTKLHVEQETNLRAQFVQRPLKQSDMKRSTANPILTTLVLV